MNARSERQVTLFGLTMAVLIVPAALATTFGGMRSSPGATFPGSMPGATVPGSVPGATPLTPGATWDPAHMWGTGYGSAWMTAHPAGMVSPAAA